MDFKQLKKELKGIEFIELRSDADSYFEAVLANGKKNDVARLLKRFFGEAVWPARKKISSQMQEAIAEYGGIRGNQTLYSYNQDHRVVFAMLWPWQDGERTTIKIADYPACAA